jgi:hypothetical protein
LENSKFCLVSNSGSSLLDPYGELRKKVNNYLSLNPNANFSEVEKNCFPGEDGKNIFTAISPRNIEAALAETVQIATPGDYSGIMKEGMDYIRLEEDCSNILEIISLIKDREKIQKIRKSCKESVLNINDLRFENHVPNLIQQIENGLNLKSINGTSQNIMEKLINSYKKQIFLRENFFWKQKRLIAKLIRTKMTLKNLIRGP